MVLTTLYRFHAVEALLLYIILLKFKYAKFPNAPHEVSKHPEGHMIIFFFPVPARITFGQRIKKNYFSFS